MNFWFHLLWLHLLCPQEAVRPHQGHLMPTERQEDLAPGDGDSNQAEFNVTIETHPIGIELDYPTGRINEVLPGRLGERSGLTEGQRISRVNGKPFKDGLFLQAQKGLQLHQEQYQLTIQSPSKFERMLDFICYLLHLPAALLGGCLWLGLPVLCACGSPGHCWKESLLAKALANPVTLSAAGAMAFGEVLLAVKRWSYLGHVGRIGAVSDFVFPSGLVLSCAWNSQHPFLRIPLHEDRVGPFQTGLFAAVLLNATRMASWLAYVLYMFRPDGVTDLCYDAYEAIEYLGWILLHMLMIAFTAVVGHVSLATCQQLSEVQAAMPCKASEFFENVHVPCGEVLKEAGERLAGLGPPLLLLAAALINDVFRWYRALQGFLLTRQDLGKWCMFINSTTACVATFYAVMLGPVQLSSAVRDFRTCLDQERRRDPAVESQIMITSLEAVLERQNDGAGFGIPVVGRLVLTEDFLQKMIVRAVLVGATIKAFLDSELGFAKEVTREEVEMLPKVLANMTAPGQKSS
mmetsp:Transcript_7364/g.12782  ORF Transcript_7364/g.12782 Transcript_7364/m.12782 type:complete len:519 (-) Transcript_7364:82-1638(-)